MCDDDVTALVCDNGSGMCKAGFAGDDAPRAVFPSIVGRPRHQLQDDLLKTLQPAYIGHEANSKRGVLSIKRPIEHNLITNWEMMEVLWENLFNHLLVVQPDKQPILMTEPPLNPRANREKMTQVMFETFGVPGLYVASTTELSLLASGRSTGVVLESGEGATFATPVYEGHSLKHCIPKIEICGSDLTYFMTKLLYEANKYSLNADNMLETPRDIKETLCYVAQDFDQEMGRPSISIERIYEKSNKEGTITVGNERFRCPEAMFKPEYCDNHNFGIHEGIFSSIMKCNPDIQPQLFSNIVLSGASTVFPGLSERLETEILKMASPGTEVKVIAPANRNLGAWIGGSQLASSPNFNKMMMTKDEYEEFGPGLVYKKCF